MWPNTESCFWESLWSGSSAAGPWYGVLSSDARSVLTALANSRTEASQGWKVPYLAPAHLISSCRFFFFGKIFLVYAELSWNLSPFNICLLVLLLPFRAIKYKILLLLHSRPSDTWEEPSDAHQSSLLWVQSPQVVTHFLGVMFSRCSPS